MLTLILSALAVTLSKAKGLLLQGRWVLLLTGLVVCCVFALTCRHEAPTPLPASVVARVERQRVESAVDSAAIKRLTRAAAVESVKSDTAVARSRQAANSGNYRRAYVVEDSAVLALDQQVALLDVALTKSETRAIQADSVIAAVLPIAESREPQCRILWLAPCPSRRIVAMVAAALTAASLTSIRSVSRNR